MKKYYLYDFNWVLEMKGTIDEICDYTGLAEAALKNHANKNSRVGGVCGWYLRTGEPSEELKKRYKNEL